MAKKYFPCGLELEKGSLTVKDKKLKEKNKKICVLKFYFMCGIATYFNILTQIC